MKFSHGIWLAASCTFSPLEAMSQLLVNIDFLVTQNPGNLIASGKYVSTLCPVIDAF